MSKLFSFFLIYSTVWGYDDNDYNDFDSQYQDDNTVEKVVVNKSDYESIHRTKNIFMILCIICILLLGLFCFLLYPAGFKIIRQYKDKKCKDNIQKLLDLYEKISSEDTLKDNIEKILSSFIEIISKNKINSDFLEILSKLCKNEDFVSSVSGSEGKLFPDDISLKDENNMIFFLNKLFIDHIDNINKNNNSSEENDVNKVVIILETIENYIDSYKNLTKDQKNLILKEIDKKLK